MDLLELPTARPPFVLATLIVVVVVVGGGGGGGGGVIVVGSLFVFLLTRLALVTFSLVDWSRVSGLQGDMPIGRNLKFEFCN